MFIKYMLIGIGGNFVCGGILGFCIVAITYSIQGGYPPTQLEWLGYATFGILSLIVTGISFRVWLRERDTPHSDRSVMTYLPFLFTILALGGFLTGGYVGLQITPKHLQNQRKWDKENCQHVLGAAANLATNKEVCRVTSRDCRNQIDCNRLTGYLQEVNMKRWPKTHKRPSSTCGTARLLCMMDQFKRMGVKVPPQLQPKKQTR